MAFNQSVYKHDYKAPSTFKFAGLEKELQSGNLCACIREAVDVQPCHLPPYISGKLRLRTPEEDNKKLPKFDCENPTHSQVWKVLMNCNPEIFNEVQSFSPEQLKHFLTKHRMSSVYQKDFCGNKTRFFGKGESKHSDLNSPAVREEVMKLIYSTRVKPKKFDISECAKFANVGRSSREEQRVVGCENHFSEYMDGISKLGCTIIKNNIHSHVRCFPKRCHHDINAKQCRFKSRWV